MLRIWGRISSINVQKVVWCADELGLACERIDAGGAFGVTKSAEYLAMNPNAIVPTIDDDGFVLYESNAIVRYLCSKQPTALWPDDARKRADADRWMEWQSTNFTPVMRDAFWQLIRVPLDKRDNAAVERSREACEKFTAILDARLANSEYLASYGFSPADIVNGCAVHRWLNLPLERVRRPHMERWYATLKSRPGSRQVTSLALS